MANLNYRAANIARAERESGLNFFKTLEGFGETSPSLSDILFILQAGGLNEDQAGELVDQKGLVDSIKEAVESLTNAGFLANSQAAIAEVAQKGQPATSQATGATTKA